MSLAVSFSKLWLVHRSMAVGLIQCQGPVLCCTKSGKCAIRKSEIAFIFALYTIAGSGLSFV